MVRGILYDGVELTSRMIDCQSSTLTNRLWRSLITTVKCSVVNLQLNNYSINQSINKLINKSINQSINQSIRMYIAPLQDPYSEVLPTLDKRKRTVFRS